MKKSVSIVITLTLTTIVLLMSSCSQGNSQSGKPTEESETDSIEGLAPEQPAVSEALLQWRAGETVSQEDIDQYGGVDKCFGFDTIPDRVWENMQGKSYQENPYIHRLDLCYIRVLHWDRDQKIHIGEMIVNRIIAQKVTTILRKLYDAKYPIERMVLADRYADDESQMRDNNSSGFCYRTVAHSGKLSKHARGLAVDINTLYNPYYKDRANGTRFIQPATAEEYCDRTKEFPYKIDHEDLCYQLFKEAGFRWGGDFRSCKDYQHFEFIGSGESIPSNSPSTTAEEDPDADTDDHDEEISQGYEGDITESTITVDVKVNTDPIPEDNADTL